ncbi:segment polarity protein dishevelled homolog DVL-2-like [Panonychus citri]|uniref:segment polarity protein dishevelled homolog DVL-2-like n=1 Tax=Panonychus citri TaxID=50023 RepID=UPI0023072B3E|nr:segment polarity protein dishevelled homolog DVL-2-like [Panonychus citri]
MSDSRPMETKLMYYNGDDDIPTLIRLAVSPNQVTLSDFKSAINLKSTCKHKFFFKTIDDDIIVKEEIADDDAKLPVFKGNIICYIESQVNDETDCSDGRSSDHGHNHGHHHHSHHHSHHGPSHYYSRCDDYSDDDTSSRISTSTNETSVSRYNPMLRRERVMSNASSVSSVTESSAIDRVIKTVTLDLDKTNYLGMSLIGQSSDRENGGIYVGSIMKGGAVAAEGTIQPGDMILQVNEHILSNMTNDQAVEILREAAQRAGKIELVVAKFFESSAESYFTIPREEPIQPLNLEAWIHTTEAATGLNAHPEFEGPPSSESASTSASHSSMPSSYARSEQRQLLPDVPELSLANSTMFTIAKYAASSDSGLVVKDRKWLKIIIPNAFLGGDLVNWLFTKVKGFNRRRDANSYAKQMMKQGHIKHTVNKKFSEFCYYVFDESVTCESSNEDSAVYSQFSSF